MTKRKRGTRGKWILDEPLCQHPPTGTVAWPEAHRKDEAHASVYSCGRRDCIVSGARWVQKCTGQLGVYRSFSILERLA